MKKNFVSDTNVILHDYDCLRNSQKNDTYLSIVASEESDGSKRGNEQINYNMREFVRELDLITDDSLFTHGTSSGGGLDKLFIITGDSEAPEVYESFPARKPDHQILAAAEFLTWKYLKTKSTPVTKDVNLRMKTRSIGTLCEDHITDEVVDIDTFEKSNEVFKNIGPELVDRAYSPKEGLDINEFDLKDILHFNECFIPRSNCSSVPTRYNPLIHMVYRVNKTKNYRIEPRNTGQSFAFEILSDPDIKLVTLTGKAGTGKALFVLVAALGKPTEYRQILLTRPTVTLSNKDLGFLPGDTTEKVAFHMQPLFDNLNVVKRQFASNSAKVKQLGDMQRSKRPVTGALTLIRGRSPSKTCYIIGEAQNLTPYEIRTIITRAGERAKMVFTGNIQQIDRSHLDSQSNGLVCMIDRMGDQNLLTHVNLVKGERSELSESANNLM